MRVVFLCSSLDPGRDGVGDYTRRLAGELIRQGQECRLISLNERNQSKAETLKTVILKEDAAKFEKSEVSCQLSEISGQKSEVRMQNADLRSPTSDKVLTSDLRPLTSGSNSPISAFSVSDFQCFQSCEGTEIECLRLPSSLGWPERTVIARKWLDDFNPDWVSLQFVPFGFHPKGLPWGLPRQLKFITGPRPLHWMFHEVWVLWDFPLSLRKRLLGQAQKIWLRSALRKLNPRAVATHLPLYQAGLRKLGAAADLLPLHGNIPVCSKRDAEQWLVDRCAPLPARKYIKAGFFGDILSTTNRSLFAARLAGFNVPGKELLVLSAGKLGGEGARLWDSLAQEFKALATFHRLGELNEREASWYLSALNHGLTAYPPELSGKSSSVATMREHSLRVTSCGSMGKTSGLADASQPTPPWTVAQSALALLQQLHDNR